MQRRILLLGDSITQESFDAPNGWGAGLASWYVRKADVVNRGFDGYNTRWILENRQRIAESVGKGFLLGTLCYGANDNAQTYQFVDLDEYEANLRTLAQWMLADLGVERLLIMAPPPYDAVRHTEFRGLPLDKAPRCDERHAAYGDRARKVAAELGTAFLSLRDVIKAEMGNSWRSALHDGLHFSGEGGKVAGAAVQRAIEEQLPDCAPERLETLLPLFEAHDPTHSDSKIETPSN